MKSKKFYKEQGIKLLTELFPDKQIPRGFSRIYKKEYSRLKQYCFLGQFTVKDLMKAGRFDKQIDVLELLKNSSKDGVLVWKEFAKTGDYQKLKRYVKNTQMGKTVREYAKEITKDTELEIKTGRA